MYYTLSFTGQGVSNANPARSCGPRPLVILSPGYGACRNTSSYIAESVARRGYIVASLDHKDSVCASLKLPPAVDFINVWNWTEANFADRAADVKNTLSIILADPQLGPMVDQTKITGMGHSLGGYTMFGIAGGWQGWYDPRFRSVVLMAPFMTPYWLRCQVAAVSVPKLYQGGSNDLPSYLLRAPFGVYDSSAADKTLMEINGAGHLTWTNLVCESTRTVADCLKTVTAAQFVVDSLADFLKYAEGMAPSSLLTGGSPLLSRFQTDITTAAPVKVQ
jgi:predicted dienelactone hydrolase